MNEWMNKRSESCTKSEPRERVVVVVGEHVVERFRHVPARRRYIVVSQQYDMFHLRVK